ncbi:hypothetical protein SEA_KASHFLOW_16 [Mycobacterium phage KashFlow]|nr:hypothetical protein SEA_KASHFLOW_16 [Mycobacterium phage KashFlow]
MTSPIRDAKADYIAALLAERASYLSAGRADRADDVAAELARMGHEVRPAKRPAPEPVERAVADEPLEQAVEAAPKRRRGRPPKGE